MECYVIILCTYSFVHSCFTELCIEWNTCFSFEREHCLSLGSDLGVASRTLPSVSQSDIPKQGNTHTPFYRIRVIKWNSIKPPKPIIWQELPTLRRIKESIFVK